MARAWQIWLSRAPSKCKVFLWLASRNRCWTADRLGRRGLPHPAACPFCDQVEEDISHLLIGCVLAREVWSSFLTRWGKAEWIPEPGDRLVEWLSSKAARGKEAKDLCTAVILVCWCLWRHRNDVVFQGHTPSVEVAIQMVEAEADLWRAASLFRDMLAPVERWRVGE